VLVVGEVALSVTLLVSAGLLIQSLYRLHSERLGFDPHGLMTFSTPNTAQHRRTAAEQRVFESTLLERLRAFPSVRSVAAVNVLPLTSQNNYPTQREGHPEQSIGGMEIRIVGSGYLQTMGISVVRGRPFDSRDDAAAAPVILVNETVAREWWPSGSPLGDHVKVGKFKGVDYGDDPPREVIGIVADTKSVYLTKKSRPTVYLPAGQTTWYDAGMDWVVRGAFSPTFGVELRRLIAEIDPRQRLDHVRTMDAIVDAGKADSRFDAYLFGILAAIALALTAIGVYGLLSFSVARRTQEIGTRMALGASRAAVLKMVLQQGLSLIAIGLALGLAGAFAVSRSLQGLLYGVRPTDPSSFVAVALLLLAAGLLASYFPARRATKIDPISALRAE
jgi:predicted permease